MTGVRVLSTMRRWGITRLRLCLFGAALIACLLCIHWLSPERSVQPASNIAVAREPTPAAGNQRLEHLAKTDHVALLDYCLDHYRRTVANYTCTFTKQERIGAVVGKEQKIAVRFRQSPFSVAMVWQANPPGADRILYIEGRNDGQMLVRPASRILRALTPEGVWRRPDSEDAKAVTLRTVDMFGFERSMTSLRAVYEEGRAGGDCKEEFGGYYKVDGRDTLLIIRTLAAQKNYPSRKTSIYIDIERQVPVLVEGLGWDNDDFLYRYAYSNVQFDAGLTGDDFTPESIGLKSK